MPRDVDILVDLNEDELLKLREKYNGVEDAYHIYTFIDVAIRMWETRELIVTSPGNAWMEDGSLIIFSERDCPNIFMYSLDKSYKKISQALLKTKRIDQKKALKFRNIFEDYMDIIMEVVNKLGRQVTDISENNLYAMNIQKAKALKIEFPTEAYVKRLGREHAKEVDAVWPHRFEHSDKMVANWIEKNVGFGVFLKHNGALVSWVLQGPKGHMNLLQTLEGYMHRGYGKLMVRVLAKYLAENGHVPVAIVLTNNLLSNKLFSSLGFEMIQKTYFFRTAPE
ncbi:uncharacterized protein LOC123314324 [Coccinella septempunctata]|uniref:uncharacterized protein LOC123314324 n=1 Tax=Coccinella septempunctata TaxID=41139 RepID=UPI001D08FC25|nr:uncharacterized protein LOC123314324 [Coccinella septempunctata]